MIVNPAVDAVKSFHLNYIFFGFHSHQCVICHLLSLVRFLDSPLPSEIILAWPPLWNAVEKIDQLPSPPTIISEPSELETRRTLMEPPPDEVNKWEESLLPSPPPLNAVSL